MLRVISQPGGQLWRQPAASLSLWRGPRQEIQCRLFSALAAPLSADRSATELILTRLASELIAILASELLHLSLHAKESRLFLSTTCDWRCSRFPALTTTPPSPSSGGPRTPPSGSSGWSDSISDWVLISSCQARSSSLLLISLCSMLSRQPSFPNIQVVLLYFYICDQY